LRVLGFINMLNFIKEAIPDGLLVDSAWLSDQGYYGSLRQVYVEHGHLERPARRVYRRPGGSLRWEHVVVSLQRLMQVEIFVGGRTALERFGHLKRIRSDAPKEKPQIHLYGPQSPASWIYTLQLPIEFKFHKSSRIFRSDGVARGKNIISCGHDSLVLGDVTEFSDILASPWEEGQWPLVISSPERAILEFLNEVPKYENFKTADSVMKKFTDINVTTMRKMLITSKNVKVNRLFLFFSRRHAHDWMNSIPLTDIEIGRGNRVLMRGGRFDRDHKITIPADLHPDT